MVIILTISIITIMIIGWKWFNPGQCVISETSLHDHWSQPRGGAQAADKVVDVDIVDNGALDDEDEYWLLKVVADTNTCKQFIALWLKFDNFKRFFPASFWALLSSEFRIVMRNMLPYIFPICIFISNLIEFLMFPILVFSGQGIAMAGVRQPFLKALLQKLLNYRSRECSMFE